MRPLVYAAAPALMLTACAAPKPTASVTSPTGTASSTSSAGASPSASASPTSALVASKPSLKVAEVNAVFPAANFTASGGLQPYHWTVVSGAIPLGLDLSGDGVLSGTPNTAGTFNFALQVSDAGTSTATVSGSILVRPALSATYIPACASTCSAEVGCTGTCGIFGTVGGGVGPYKYAYVANSGALPSGTSVATNAMALTGTFGGSMSSYQFTESVTDAYGETATLSPYFNVYDHLSFAGGPVTCPYNGCTPPGLPYAGGIGVVSAQIVGGWAPKCTTTCSPAKPTVSVAAGNVIVNVPASTGGNGYTATLQVQVSDKAPCTSTTYCSVIGVVAITVQAG